jgi:pyruvate-ferredoxin/flavodoxin oxidoreductase
MDSGTPTIKLTEFTRNETRFRMVERKDPERFQRLMARSQIELRNRFSVYEQLAAMQLPAGATEGDVPGEPSGN